MGNKLSGVRNKSLNKKVGNTGTTNPTIKSHSTTSGGQRKMTKQGHGRKGS